MESKRLNIVVHTVSYKPELVGMAAYNTAMCEWLAERGHNVHVICPPPHYPAWTCPEPYKSWKYEREVLNGVQVSRCPVWLPNSPRSWQRVLFALSFMLSSLPVLLKAVVGTNTDVLFVTGPSFLNMLPCIVASRLSKALGWAHIQDFEVDIALGMNQFQVGWFGRAVQWFESAVLRQYSAVSTISSRMMDRLAHKQVAPERQVFFPNWVDTASIYPTERSSQLRLAMAVNNDELVCLFSGSLGEKQGVDTMISAAQQLQHHPHLVFVVCGAGPALPALRKQAEGLKNVRFLDLRPLEELNDLLNAADIHILTQRRSVADMVMPSKLLGMLASGRPIIATADVGTEVAKTVAPRGLVVDPDNSESLAAAILRLAENAAERRRLGAAARAFALSHCSGEAVLGKFESELYARLALTPPVTVPVPAAASAAGQKRRTTAA